VVRVLREEETELLMDYLHRFMQYVGESENAIISSGNMLKLYERIVKEYGASIIAKQGFRSDTLVVKVQNY
jgi:hypothetical protein